MRSTLSPLNVFKSFIFLVYRNDVMIEACTFLLESVASRVFSHVYPSGSRSFDLRTGRKYASTVMGAAMLDVLDCALDGMT